MARTANINIQHTPVSDQGISPPRKADKRKEVNIQTKDADEIGPRTWGKCIGLISQGVRPHDAVTQCGIRKAALEGTLRTNPKRKAHWEDAKTAAMWRHWDIETLEEVMIEIAMGATVVQVMRGQQMDHKDLKEHKRLQQSFYSLIMRDPIVKEMYDEARMIQAEKMAIDDIMEIADERRNDITEDGKGNAAAVNRSRLMVDSRKWVAAKMHYKRFGDKIQQDVEQHLVVDHAVRLEEARRRKEKAHAERRKGLAKTRKIAQEHKQ